MGLGGAPLGGLYGDIPDEQAHAVVHRALELGINLIDTAPAYGRGRSELRLGKALADVPRDSYVVSTKVGRLLVPGDGDEGSASLRSVFDFSHDGIMRSYEESLARLSLDRIDILHIHDPYLYYEQAMKEAYPALAKLRDQGAIRGVSVGMGSVELLLRFANDGEFDCFLLSNLYNLLDQPALAELLPVCTAKGIGIMAGGTYSSGILATGSRVGARYRYRAASEDVLKRVRELEAVASRHGVNLRAAASQFALAHPAITAIIPGTRRPERVEKNLERVRDEIPGEFWVALRDGGLIPEGAPVPGRDPVLGHTA
jgi:D-threo-aldose 1-dehydrogenase